MPRPATTPCKPPRASAGVLCLCGEAGHNPIVHPGILSPTAIVGRIDGGTNTNVVPGKVVLKLDRRMIPEEDPAQVETDVRVLIDQPCWLARHLSGRAPHSAGARIAPLPGHEQMVTSLQRHASAVFGEDIPAVGTPLYADARLYGEHGIPVLMYGAGPRTLMESRAKQADENVALADLRGATKVVAGMLADLLTAPSSSAAS